MKYRHYEVKVEEGNLGFGYTFRPVKTVIGNEEEKKFRGWLARNI